MAVHLKDKVLAHLFLPQIILNKFPHIFITSSNNRPPMEEEREKETNEENSENLIFLFQLISNMLVM